MDEKRIRIGVAGLGRIGWSFHCARLAKHPDFDLVAVADTEEARRREAEDVHGCSSWSGFEEMIAGADLQAVVIATPTHLHLPMAEHAFANGLHVLLEKPMAPDAQQGEEIVRAATESKRILTVYQPHRLNAYFQHLRHIVESGKIGKVYWVERGSFSFARRNDWQSLQEYGGGMLNNYGAHFLDQVLQLVGYDIKRVFCDLQIVASLGDADDVVRITLETEGGVLGEVVISQASVIKPYEFIVWGTHGGITLTGNVLSVRYFDPAKLPPKTINPKLASHDRKYPSDAIDFVEEQIVVDPAYQLDVFANFATSIRTATPPLVRPEETLALMRILEQCRRDSGGVDRPG